MNNHACSHGCSHAHEKERSNRYRLPKNVVPSRYDIGIKATPGNTEFEGTVAIEARVLTPSREVTLNAKNLTIDSVVARHENGTALNGTVSLDCEFEMAHIRFDGVLGAGDWIFELSFTGKHDRQSAGFFTSTYQVGEETKYALCTQFESADARSAFPCFDEPEYKATFKVRLDVPESMTALSNGDAVSVTADGAGRKVVEFEETLKISSYLVCFTVGELVSTEPVDVNGKRLRVWCVPGKEDQTGLAVRVSAFGLRFFEEYFDTPYPFGKKIDFVAIPGYAWGGMENPGLIIFTENCLLTPVEHEDSAHYLVRVILHELAHQWFGNLVTMRWWNGLWLNESFATFMGHFAAEHWNPAWKVWDEFSNDRECAYAHDALISSHPIEQDVEIPGHASYQVDPIAYDKGCAVIYQISSFIGANVFRDGMRHYMKAHAFGNTESGDLWVSLEAACRMHQVNVPIRDIMKTWVFQKGHPIVMVCETGEDSVELSQSPFLILKRGRKSHKLWPVPITLQVMNEDGTITTRKMVLSARKQRVHVGAGYRWVKLNAGGTGFYRVGYSEVLREKLTEDMLQLSDIEQTNLLYDWRALFKACLIPADEFMQLLFKFTQVNDFGSWWAIGEGMNTIAGLTSAGDRSTLVRVVADLLESTASKWGWDPASNDVLPFLQFWEPYHLNLSPMVQQASRVVLKKWRANRDEVFAGFASTAAMILHFARARMPGSFRDLQKAAHHNGPLDLQHYIVEIAKLNAAAGKPYDIWELFADAMLFKGHSKAHEVDRLENEWPELIQTASSVNIMYRIRYNVDKVDEADLELRLRKLFRKHPHKGAKPEINRLLERVRGNVVMKETQTRSLSAYIARRKKGTSNGVRLIAA